MKWFLERVLPALVIALILFVLPVLTGIVNKESVIQLLGGVPSRDFRELKAQFDSLSSQALRDNDKVWLLTQRDNEVDAQLTAERNEGGGFFMQVWPGPSTENKRKWKLQRISPQQ